MLASALVRRRVIRWIVVCTALVCATAGVWLFLPAGPKRPNFIFLMIDTLRADAPGWARHEPSRSPFLSRLAAHATRFTRAYSASSWTAPAVASLLTSRYQSQHAVLRFGSILNEQEVTLPEVLRAAGYRTAGFTTNILTAPALGFGQGFEVYDYLFPDGAADANAAKVRAAALHERALSWLDTTGLPGAAPFFLYLHYMDVHVPLHPSATALAAAHQLPRPSPLPGVDEKMLLQADPQTQETHDMRDLYAAELIDLDREIETFFAGLDRRGLLRDTVVVLVADHGEEFLEHGQVGHGLTLFDEVLRVPLLIALPGQTTADEIDRITSTTALAPTIVDLGGAAPVASFEGHSLRRLLGGGLRASVWQINARRAATAYAELLEISLTNEPAHQHAALITDGIKVLDVADHGTEAYDLANDPHETHLLDVGDHRVQEVRSELDQFRDALVAPAHPVTREIDAETRERMRALGYKP